MAQKDTQLETETNLSPQNGPRRTILLTEEQFRDHLKQLATVAGSNAETGRRLGVTGQFIDLLIAGRRKPGKKLCAAIGARRRLMFEIDVEAE